MDARSVHSNHKPVMRNRHVWWVLLPLLWVMWIGSRNLNADGIWYDEWWSLYNAGAFSTTGWPTPAATWTHLLQNDPWQTPGYPWLLNLWLQVTGSTPFAGRLLSLLAGVLSVAVVYRLGSTLSRSPWVGLGAACALAGSAWFLYFTHELRGYSLIILGSGLLGWLSMRARHELNAVRWLSLTVCGVMVLYVHYFAVLAVVPVLLWHGWSGLRRQMRLRQWVVLSAAFVVMGLAFVPWLMQAYPVIQQTQQEARVTMTLEALVRLMQRWVMSLSSGSWAVLILVLAASLSHRRARGLALLVGITIGCTLMIYAVLRLSEPRYGSALLPWVALLMGWGLNALRRSPGAFAAVVGVWLLGGLMTDQQFTMQQTIQDYGTQPIREMVQVSSPYWTADERVLNPVQADIRWATQQLTPLNYYLVPHGLGYEVIERATHPTLEAYRERIRAATTGAERFWVFRALEWPNPDWGLFEAVLHDEGIERCITVAATARWEVHGYARVDAAGSGVDYAAGIRIGALSRLQMQADHVQQWIRLGVDAGVPANTYSVSLRLVNAEGVLLAQEDFPLPTTGMHCRLQRFPVGATGDGLRMEVIVYAWQSGERLMGVDAAGQTGDMLRLPG
jgi:hypothetical protein